MKKPHAFTLVELLVVIAIIVVLIAILLPSLASARTSARRAVCLSHVRGLSQSMQLYIAEWNSLLPNSWPTAGPPPITASNMWSIPLAKYGNSDKLRQCPEATITSELVTIGTSISSWTQPSLTTSAKGGFAINGWLSGTGVDEDSNWNDADDLTNTPNFFGSRPSFKGYSPAMIQSQASVPSFVDAIWSEAFPTPANPVPLDLTTGSGVATQNQMGQVCISRHRKSVNVAFFDDHAENVPLQNLWTLKWYPNWVPPNPLPKIP